MPLIDMQARLIPDAWRDGEPIDRAGDQPLIVSVETLLHLTSREIADAQPVGVRLPAGTAIETLAHALAHLDLIVIAFPSFRDGRGFTAAATLRNRHHFTGELRAAGHILPDQFDALRKCGFSTIETPPAHPPESWRAALTTRAANSAASPLLKRLLDPVGIQDHVVREES